MEGLGDGRPGPWKAWAVEGSDPTKPLFSPISRNPAEKFQTLFKLVVAPAGRRPRHGPATPACRFDEIPNAQGCERPSGGAGACSRDAM